MPEGPSCLILDIRLPGMSGLEGGNAKSIDAGLGIPVIFISAHADVDMAVRAMKLGAVEFLTKPFRPQELVDAVQQALHRDEGIPSGTKRYLAVTAAIQNPNRPRTRGDGTIRFWNADKTNSLEAWCE